MKNQVAEIVTFKLAKGVSDEDFVTLSQASEAFVRSQSGFVHRRLSRGEDGSWTDYVIWQDIETAQRVAEEFHQQAFCGALMQAIAPDSANMRHEEVLWGMTP